MECDQDQSATAPKADHLCVLVHGLWGNPTHMGYIEASLKKRYDDGLYILAAARNTGNLTYDGIEVCGERLAHEIEETLESLATKGYQIRKFSIVGYSLGGLISRYALGLLFARGWFGKLEPVNFTTFASPHLGVRAPVKGFQNYLFNSLGARTVSTSGKQMFLTDKFQNTGKPLISALADPNGIFLQALARFKHRSVYGNIHNDTVTQFYTTIFTPVDHFRDPESLCVNYVKGYEPVVIDPDVYTLPAEKREPYPFPTRVWDRIRRFFNKLPFWLLFTTIITISLPIFLCYSVVETFRSQKRIRTHEEGPSATLFSRYRVPMAVKRIQTAVEEVFESAASRQNPDYLASSSAALSDLESQVEIPVMSALSKTQEDMPDTLSQARTLENDDGVQADLTFKPSIANADPKPPTLALTADQFSMIKSLNAVGFRKYPIYIHNDSHTHAAIIVRSLKDTFDEGRVVIKHWLDCGFEV